MAYKPPPPMVTLVLTSPSLSSVYSMSLALSLACMSLYPPVSPLYTVCLSPSLSSLYSMSLALSLPCL